MRAKLFRDVAALGEDGYLLEDILLRHLNRRAGKELPDPGEKPVAVGLDDVGSAGADLRGDGADDGGALADILDEGVALTAAHALEVGKSAIERLEYHWP